MTTVILTEKASAAKNFAEAFGGMRGTYKGERYQIVHAAGHILEFHAPHNQVQKSLIQRYEAWDLKCIPWNETEMSWKKKISSGKSKLLTNIKKAINNADKVVIATDNDPSGEGDMIAWEILEYIGYKGIVERMYFEDEEKNSLQYGWDNRVILDPDPKKHDAYMKAYVRERWDFLSMQLVRACTVLARQEGYQTVVRAGRLKSVIVKIVYDQIQARKDFIRKPYFEVKYKDNYGHIYSRKLTKDDDLTGIRFHDKSDAEDDKQNFINFGTPILTEKVQKKKEPGKLLDLQGLASILAPKGYQSKEVLATYQKMYQAKIVSYPRTEDKYITIDQFNAFLQNADAIANLVGVDTSHLIHREPRKTHIRNGQAHGANRPGKKVPNSLDELKKYGKSAVAIYTLLAKNSLAMLAEDYIYDSYKAAIKESPDFITQFNVPVKQGFKIIFDTVQESAEEHEEQEKKGLGSSATLFVDEGSNKKPAKPTQKWLKSRLEKYNVGTGATRLSTISEISNGENSLLKDTKGTFNATQTGMIAWALLNQSWIGSAKTTERLLDLMNQVGSGNVSKQYVIDTATKLINHDKEIFIKNASKLKEAVGEPTAENIGYKKKEKVQGVWKDQEISFSRSFGGEEFTDDEINKLLNGESISITRKKKDGKSYTATGKLKEKTYKKKKFIGFDVEKFS